MEYFSSDEADPAAYLAGLQGTYVANDEAIFDDLAGEDEILESISTAPEEPVVEEVTDQVADAADAVAELDQEPAGETPADQVLTEEEPPESSAV
jgi:hypothetical protein